MKKIVILTSVHPAFDARIFHKQAKTVASAGYNVTLIAQYDKNGIVDGVKITSLPKPRNRFERIIGLSFRVLNLALKEKADIYNFHDPELIPVGLFLKLFTGAKVIYDVHEDYSETILSRYWIPSHIRKIIAISFSIFESLASHYFDYIITATNHIKKRFRGRNVMSIKNYPLTIDIVPIHRIKRFGQIILIYAGSLDRDYGTKEIVRALGILKEENITLKLFGKFETDWLKQEIKSLPGYSKVEYLGRVNRDEIINNMMKADIGLSYDSPLPRFKAGLSTKVLEYMAVGLPVIVSRMDISLDQEIVETNNCGLAVEPMNPYELAKAIKYLIENPDVREEMGKNGRKAIMEKYNWEQESKKFLDLYAYMLDQKTA